MARQEDGTVMLSTFAMLSVNSAKHLEAHPDRPFATLRVTRRGHPTMWVIQTPTVGQRIL